MPLILPRPDFNALVYPVGRAPGFDPTHIASLTVSRVHGLSTVATSSGMLNLLTGTVPTTTLVAGSSFGLRKFGPAFIWTTGAIQSAKFSGTTIQDKAGTLAFIGTLVTGGGGNLFLATDAGNTGGMVLKYLNAAGLTFTMPNIGTANSGAMVIPTINPMFVVVSKGPAVINFLCLDLIKGTITTSVVANSSTPNAPGVATTMLGGISGATTPIGAIGAAMFAPSFMTMEAMQAWASDPWSFWYPRRGPGPELSLELFGKPSSAISVNLTAISATGAVAALKTAISKALVAAAGSGAVEAFQPTDQRVLSGVAATAAVESLKPSLSKTLTAAAAIGAVEALSRAEQRALTAVAATGAVEALTPSIGKALGDAAASSAVEAFAKQISHALSGVAASGTAADGTAELLVSLGDAAAVGAVEAFTVEQGEAASLVAVAASGAVEAFAPRIQKTLAAVAAIGAAEALVASKNATVSLGAVSVVGGVAAFKSQQPSPPIAPVDDDDGAGLWAPVPRRRRKHYRLEVTYATVAVRAYGATFTISVPFPKPPRAFRLLVAPAMVGVIASQVEMRMGRRLPIMRATTRVIGMPTEAHFETTMTYRNLDRLVEIDNNFLMGM